MDVYNGAEIRVQLPKEYEIYKFKEKFVNYLELSRTNVWYFWTLNLKFWSSYIV